MKNKLLLAVITSIILSGCTKEPESTEKVGKEFVVEELFTHKGCTLFRFADNGRYIYYSDCKGSVNYTSRNGKTTIKHITQTNKDD